MKISPQILEEFIYRIEELSDRTFQYNVWLGKQPEIESSFLDVLFFFKNELNHNLLDEYTRALGFENNLDVKKLITLLINYDFKNKTDIEIIEDSEWEKVVYQAKVVLDQYNSIKSGRA